MKIAETLRHRILKSQSISRVAKDTGIPQATLQEFAVGRSDGSLSDLRLSTAQVLLEHFGIVQDLGSPAPFQKGKRMYLAKELEVYQCPDSPEKFRERLLDRLQEDFSEMTIDDLVCSPSEALEFCDRIRSEIGTESMSDSVILKTLMNIRRSNDCPTGLKRDSSRKHLKTVLTELGIEIDPVVFKESLNDCFADMYKSRTRDELLCYPREAMAYCNYVRSKIGTAIPSDKLILSRLINNRKDS